MVMKVKFMVFTLCIIFHIYQIELLDLTAEELSQKIGLSLQKCMQITSYANTPNVKTENFILPTSEGGLDLASILISLRNKDIVLQLNGKTIAFKDTQKKVSLLSFEWNFKYQKNYVRFCNSCL